MALRLDVIEVNNCVADIFLYRYWYLCLDVQEYLHSFLEADSSHSSTDVYVCSDILHGLQTVPQSLCKLTLYQSRSLLAQDHSYEHRRFGI